MGSMHYVLLIILLIQYCILFCVKLYPNLCCVVLLCWAEFYLFYYIAFALHLQLHLHITTSRQVGQLRPQHSVAKKLCQLLE